MLLLTLEFHSSSMLFNKRKEEKLLKAINESTEHTYWKIVKKQFFKNRLAVWALRVFYFILFIALMADFIANERPYYCKIKMETSRDTVDVIKDTLIRIDTIVQISEGNRYFDSDRTDVSISSAKKDEFTLSTTKTTYNKQQYTFYDQNFQLLENQNEAAYIILRDSLFITSTLIELDSNVCTYFPIFRQYLVDLGWVQWEETFVITKWLEHQYEVAYFPPITYSPTTRDVLNAKFQSPFGPQEFPEKSNGGWHYLGTERIGQDVAAGMIHGTRTAMLVGVVAMSIATLLGLFFGSIAGYFGDDRLKMSRIKILLNIFAFLLSFFLVFIANGYLVSDWIGNGHILLAVGFIALVFGLILFLSNLLAFPLQKIKMLGKAVTVPLDILIMRLIEIVNSIPLLILILSIVAIIEKPSVLFVMVIIGSVSWTGIAKFIRAELLRIRKLEYIEAAQAFGFNEFRIIIKHAIPNALAPVFIAIAFGVATAILMEAFLSFIGVGIPDDQITWGSLLRLSQDKFSAWWLAIFPGFAIFVTVTVFNLIGEGLTEALDPKLRD